jgi:hypothetical protein
MSALVLLATLVSLQLAGQQLWVLETLVLQTSWLVACKESAMLRPWPQCSDPRGQQRSQQ